MLMQLIVKFDDPNHAAFFLIGKWCKVIPQKIRELVKTLERAGFVNRGGKGSHRNYEHPTGLRVTLSGSLGNDAKPYQIRIVRETMKELEQ